MKELKKKDIKAFMYKSRFVNKAAFIADMDAKRAARRANKEIDMEMPLAIRYKALIPKDNFKQLESILMRAIGIPSAYTIYYRAGNTNIEYDGTYPAGNYSRRNRWAKTGHCFTITAPRRLQIDREYIDGLYNIDCRLIHQIAGVELYKATWIVKHRGYDFTTQSGFVACCKVKADYHSTFLSCHAETAQKALAGLKKQRKAWFAKRPVIKSTEIITIDIFRKLTGACQPGCVNFINKHGLSMDIAITAAEAVQLLKDKGEFHFAWMLENKLA